MPTATISYFVLHNDIYFERADSNGDGVFDGLDTDYRAGLGWSVMSGISGSSNHARDRRRVPLS
jgi:hypothetical protein